MTTEEKIVAIQTAIENAKNHQSKMDETAWSVPALSSLKIRHLMNNLGSLSTCYMEHGNHRGGVFCSVLRNNPNIEIAYWCDNFASDKETGENIEEEFISNAMKCIEGTNTVLLGEVSDTFDLPGDFGENVDLYCFDASHDYDSQRRAITHFLPSMAKECIICIDDYDWEDVSRGTKDGLKEAKVEILYEQAFKGNDHDNSGYWNGFYLALIRKNKTI